MNKVAWHAGLRYHRLCIQHKCQHLCSHRSGTAENFRLLAFARGRYFFDTRFPKSKNCGQRFSKQEGSGMRIVQYVLDEISLIRERDPAINSPAEVFLYPCFWAVLWYRLAHRLYLKKRYFVARMISQCTHEELESRSTQELRSEKWIFY